MREEVLAICIAYESGFGHAGRDLCNPYPEGTDPHDAYSEGKRLAEQRGAGAVRNEALEEAAKVAEEQKCDARGDRGEFMNIQCDKIATIIRAMKISVKSTPEKQDG